MFELADYVMTRKRVWAISDLPPARVSDQHHSDLEPGLGLRSNLEITAGL